ncbi:S1C family serine protease [Rivibacter subsaxonicus]|uniref:Serine peptidase DegS n=1 Tax=Rivibacter subsaxonicus TaxID=457575 RepID=A0A4V2FSQ4_9BURK|nr:trypsin-like peptidase domain-containing protein [Rivibacter subsaxonicus]RZT95165.1 serine peptidase DegS [Rivibacter subsaxonicus]
MRKIWLIFSQAVTIGLAMLFVVATLRPDWLSRSEPVGAPATLPAMPVPGVGAVQPAVLNSGAAASNIGFSQAARRASPAVVSIVTSKLLAQKNPHAGEPWSRFFFGDRDSPPPSGMGSGVIVSAEGYLLTNNHVVEGMDGIEVALADGRRTRAEVVGTDPESDLAVLRIKLDALPVINFGNSETLQVGDLVLAIGNPFGVGQTVTSGIVSALGRNQLGINTFENFIQTDAAINPGNSGGALVDATGALMGISTAIYSRSGGNLGIGFAIPSATAKQVMDSLIRDGVVTRGWIGVEPRELTPEMAENFNLPTSQGVLITGVLQGGPASEGGLRPGDVVVRVAETRVANTAQLLAAVAALKPRSEAALQVLRGKQQMELKIRVAQRPRATAER